MNQRITVLKTILVVEDEEDLRAVVREILRDEGYAVLEAPHGLAMLEVLGRERVDLVLMDVMMPGGDGRDAYRELRARPDLPMVPVVMMSAVMHAEAQDASLAGFLRKPFDLDQLLDIVRSLIGPPQGSGSS